jgi:uncharacterized repeat protein (TIGR01451 family)
MRFLRFAVVATLAAAASALVAVPASAQVPPIHPIPTNLLPLIFCPKDGALTLVKTADKTDYNVGDVVTFTLRVHANNCDATGVKVHDQLPTGLTVSDPTVLNHDFGAISAGTDQSFSFKAVAVAKGTWTNKAQAAGNSIGDTDPGLLCVTIYSKVATTDPTLINPVKIYPTPPPTYMCPKSAAAEVTINVTAPTPTPNPTPTPTPPPANPGNPGVPQLPNTGRQG